MLIWLILEVIILVAFIEPLSTNMSCIFLTIKLTKMNTKTFTFGNFFVITHIKIKKRPQKIFEEEFAVKLKTSLLSLYSKPHFSLFSIPR